MRFVRHQLAFTVNANISADMYFYAYNWGGIIQPLHFETGDHVGGKRLGPFA